MFNMKKSQTQFVDFYFKVQKNRIKNHEQKGRFGSDLEGHQECPSG